MRAAFAAVLVLLSAPAAAQKLVKVQAPPMAAQCDDLETAPLAAAIDKQAALLRKRSGTMQIGDQSVSMKDYAARTLEPLAALVRQGTPTLCAELPKRFDFYRNGGAKEGHFTVYYHPILRA